MSRAPRITLTRLALASAIALLMACGVDTEKGTDYWDESARGGHGSKGGHHTGGGSHGDCPCDPGDDDGDSDGDSHHGDSDSDSHHGDSDSDSGHHDGCGGHGDSDSDSEDDSDSDSDSDHGCECPPAVDAGQPDAEVMPG